MRAFVMKCTSYEFYKMKVFASLMTKTFSSLQNTNEITERAHISVEDIQPAIRKFKLGKAPGAYKIHPEVITNQGREVD